MSSSATTFNTRNSTHVLGLGFKRSNASKVPPNLSRNSGVTLRLRMIDVAV